VQNLSEPPVTWNSVSDSWRVRFHEIVFLHAESANLPKDLISYKKSAGLQEFKLVSNKVVINW